MKCKVCGKQITSLEVKQDKAIKINYKDKNLYFCCDIHCGEYFKIEKEKEHNAKLLDEIDKFVKSELEYFNQIPILPKSLYTRINDLKNGTMRIGFRQIKNGTNSGYPYEVILQTFKKCKDNINFCIINKLQDANESKKVNYIMAIIDNNINDTYKQWLQGQKTVVERNIEFLDNIPFDEIVEPKESKNDLTEFFTDWD